MTGLNDRYVTRRAGADEGEQLKQLFDAVFHPEDVGTLALTLFDHLPRMKPQHWFVAVDKASEQMVAGFALIPWTLELEGIRLQVAEQGIVGTLEAHRGRGLMHQLNTEFDLTLQEEGFDLAMIQGIPGFYQQFGFHYALPLENHINVALHTISGKEDGARDTFTIRLADTADIPFLLQQDEIYRSRFSVATVRDESNWRYLLTESRATEYGSEFWIMEQQGVGPRFYCRIPKDGFGTGLIVSEISDDISFGAMEELLRFCGQKAQERDKPYIRLNLHSDSSAGRMAVAMGAEAGKPYAWQVKLPDLPGYLKKIGPVLEKRLRQSPLSGYSGALRLNLYKQSVDLVWKDGKLIEVRPGQGECSDALNLGADMFAALGLGHRSWRELRHIRPDTYPSSGQSALLIEALFPPTTSWIHEQY